MLLGLSRRPSTSRNRIWPSLKRPATPFEAGADVAVRSLVRCGHDVADGTIAAVAAEDDVAAASGVSRPAGQRARDRIADDGQGTRPLSPARGRPVKSAR